MGDLGKKGDVCEMDELKGLNEEVRITAEPNGLRCKFVIDRQIYSQGSIHFSRDVQKKSTGLAEKLFQIGNVATIQIAGSEVIVTVSQPTDWKVTAKEIGKIIREQILSKEPAVHPDLKLFSVGGGGGEGEGEGDDKIRTAVQEIFDKEINPAIASHGGRVDLIDVKDNKIYLQMSGGCHGCGSADMTLRQGIETAIRERLPDIAEIIDVTNHASGTNPYY